MPNTLNTSKTQRHWLLVNYPKKRLGDRVPNKHCGPINISSTKGYDYFKMYLLPKEHLLPPTPPQKLPNCNTFLSKATTTEILGSENKKGDS